MKSVPVRGVDDYLTALPKEKRAALEKLRKIIRSVVPDAREVISYGMPVFKSKTKSLVGFAAFKDHCSFFPMSPSVMEAHKDELKPYETAKGTIRFPANKPLPAALVKTLVKARIAENEAGRRNHYDKE